MLKRTEEMKLSSVGLLLLLTAAAMILFADLGPMADKHAKAGLPSVHNVK